MKALKAFNYSRDGFATKRLEVGDDAADVPADLVPGLVAEGYLGEDKPAPKQTKVAEPVTSTGAAQPIAAAKAAE
jgi:hypothetical protein